MKLHHGGYFTHFKLLQVFDQKKLPLSEAWAYGLPIVSLLLFEKGVLILATDITKFFSLLLCFFCLSFLLISIYYDICQHI